MNPEKIERRYDKFVSRDRSRQKKATAKNKKACENAFEAFADVSTEALELEYRRMQNTSRQAALGLFAMLLTLCGTVAIGFLLPFPQSLILQIGFGGVVLLALCVYTFKRNDKMLCIEYVLGRRSAVSTERES